jgi:translocation and assembly module TamB
MKRRHLVVLVSGITLVTLIIVAVAIVGVGVGTDWGRSMIRSVVESEVSGRVQGKVHIGTVSGTVLTGFSIDTFAIRDERDSLLVSTGRVTLNYDPRDLMDRRLLFRNVRVQRPVVRLRQYDDGSWNFQAIFGSDRPSTPGVPGRAFGDYIVLENLSVTDGEFILTRPWSPDDSLRGAKRDSAIKRNLENPEREIRRADGGYVHTYRWSRIAATLPRVRIADPDSAGMLALIDELDVDELEPPFAIRNAKGEVRKLGDSVFVDVAHFDLPASTGRARGKIWWGSALPIRVDVRVDADSVSLRDVAWVYETLPREGVGRAKLHIRNNRDNFYAFEYALSDMDVRSTRSRLQGAMTFVVGNEVLEVRNVDLRASPVNFDLFRTLAGEPFPVDWQGDLFGHVRGPGGPLTNFVVAESDLTWRDSHVAGAVSRFSGRGELDILDPALTEFHGFDVNVASLDLRSIQFLFPEFPRLGGTVAGVATLDSSWLDVRFSNANVTHRNGPGEPTRVTGSGRVTWSEEFMTYDVALNAEPLSLDMMSRAYPLGLTGLLSGAIGAKGTTENLQLSVALEGPAGRIAYDGTVDAYPLSVAARGSGRVDALDLSKLVAASDRVPTGFLTGTYQLDVRGDTSDLGTLTGAASALIERSELDGIRIYPSRLRARFADGRMHIDTLRIESTAARVEASGAIGLARSIEDSLQYVVSVDSLGGLRRYVQGFLPVTDASAAGDSISGMISLAGVARGTLRALDLSGRITGRELFIRREAGREISGTYALSNIQSGPNGSLDVDMRDLNVGGIRLDSLGLDVRFDGVERDGGTFALGALSANGVRLAAAGDIASSADSMLALTIRSAALVTDSSRWTLRGVAPMRQTPVEFGLDSLVLANGSGGRIAFEARVPRAGNAGTARIFLRADSLPLYDVGRVAQLEKSLSGLAFVTGQGAGTTAAPMLRMQATLRDLRYGGVRLERVSADANYANRRVAVAIDLAREGRTAIVARGALPLEFTYFGMRTLPDSLTGSVRTENASFEVVEAFIPGLRDAKGRLEANLDIRGTWEHPDIAGGLRVEEGDVFVDSLGIQLRGVEVDLRLFGHADSLAIERFSAWSGAGPSNTAAVTGYVMYRDMANPYLALRLDARAFHALNRRSLARLDVSTTGRGVQLTGRLHGASLRGDILVDRGVVFLPDPELARKQVDWTSGLRDTTTTDVAVGATSRLLESIIIDGVSVTLGDEVWLRSAEADIKLGGTLNVQRRPTRGVAVALGSLQTDSVFVPTLDGVLRAERGTYTLALGLVRREFQVEGGTITFFGASELPPELNISALHTVRTVNANDLRIRVRLSGPLYPNPIVTLESAESFALSQSDLVSYLIFGQPNFELGNERRGYVALAAQTLFPSAQTIVASQLRSWVGSAADFLQLRPGTADAGQVLNENNPSGFGTFLEDFLWTSRLGGEKQITNNLFVSLSTGLCPFDPSRTEDPQELFFQGLSGKLEYRLSRDASIKAGKEPSATVCRPNANVGRVVDAPGQWGLSLFKTWRF